MCTVSTEVMTLKDPPCIWQNSLRGTPKTGSKRAGLWSMTEMAQLPRRRPGYGLKPSGMLPEPESNISLVRVRSRGKTEFSPRSVTIYESTTL